MTAKILIFAGSTRKGAFSGHMAEAASKELAAQGASITHIGFQRAGGTRCEHYAYFVG